MKNKSKKWVVYVSTFPPRECGIATFTQDLMNAFDDMYNPREEAKVIAMNVDDTTLYAYDTKKVIYQIPQPEEKKYVAAAKYLNSLNHVSLVHVQHEFGIFGGTWGKNIVLFLRELSKPAIITFHTVIPSPESVVRETVQAIDNHVQSIVVMTETSKKILMEDYGVAENKIVIIPHGIHPVNFSDGVEARKELKLSKNKIILTFGLLSRGKGIEYGIEAMKKVIKKCPEAVYLIVGETHPLIRKREGETYRNSLIKKVHNLGLESHVFFYDKYMSVPELLRFIEAAHVYLSLSQSPTQAVSGTLSYALGSGRPVVSTAFAQAKEDVGNDMGTLVGFKGSKGIAEAILEILNSPEKRASMAKNSYFKTRSRTWPNVMLRHMTEYIRLAPTLAEEEKNLPKIKLEHMFAMTDDFGMIQFAHLLSPDPASGYTTDDNARALVAAVKHYNLFGKKRVLELIKTYLNFLEYVQIPEGGFHNFVNINKNISDGQPEKFGDTTARALHALAMTAVSSSLSTDIKEKASTIFEKHIHSIYNSFSPRSLAHQIKALAIWNERGSSEETLEKIKHSADKLVKYYESAANGSDWRWFEDTLTYSNGIIPDALVDAYKILKDERYLTVARESLDFLINNSFEGNVCMPVGQKDWFKKGQKKSVHDQQPEEVATLVSTLRSMFDITRDERYRRRMKDAFYWFLGNNSLTRVVYDHETGGSYDGVGERDINLDEGAESTIMYLLARLELEHR